MYRWQFARLGENIALTAHIIHQVIKPKQPGSPCGACQDHPKYKQAARARKPETKLRIMLGACQGVTKDELSGAPQPKYRSAVVVALQFRRADSDGKLHAHAVLCVGRMLQVL